MRMPKPDRLLQFVGQGAVHLGHVPIDQPCRLQCLTAGSLGIGFGAENRHHAVADELIGGAACRHDRAADRLKKSVEDEDDIVGQAAFDQLGRGADIDKQDRDKAFRPGFGCVETVLATFRRKKQVFGRGVWAGRQRTKKLAG
jgi:hypothetical protein